VSIDIDETEHYGCRHTIYHTRVILGVQCHSETYGVHDYIVLGLKTGRLCRFTKLGILSCSYLFTSDSSFPSNQYLESDLARQISSQYGLCLLSRIDL
jgi:hypothetical protein